MLCLENMKANSKFSLFDNCIKSCNMCTVLSSSRPAAAVCVKWMIEGHFFLRWLVKVMVRILISPLIREIVR